jgi:hypothetical protein
MKVHTVTEIHSTKPSMFSVFRNRSFTSLWVGELISGMGSALTTLAASILVFRITGSALSVGLMLIATVGPTFLDRHIAGVSVDGYDRIRILVTLDLRRGNMTFLIQRLIHFTDLCLNKKITIAIANSKIFVSSHSNKDLKLNYWSVA